MTNDIPYVIVDTNIWHYAYITPKEDEFVSLHEMSKKLMADLLLDASIKIALSSYQVGEILELLRKNGMSADLRRQLLGNFYCEKFLIKELIPSDVKACLDKSIVSNIHVYDYFVVIPLKGLVTKIYSADDHLQHSDFTKIAQVTNPLSPWILREGCKPQKILA